MTFILTVAAGLLSIQPPAEPPQTNHTGAYFDLWFKRCDPAALSRMAAADAVIVNRSDISFSRAEEMKFYEERCKEPAFGTPAFPMRREEIAGTFRSTPLKGYGVLEAGEHRFVLRGPDGQDRELARGKFLSVWEQVGPAWQLKRMYGYDVVTPAPAR